MENEFIKMLEKSKTIPKRKQKPRLSKAGKKKKQKMWPEDFVNQPHSLADLINAKCEGSGWYDEEYEAGKDW